MKRAIAYCSEIILLNVYTSLRIQLETIKALRLRRPAFIRFSVFGTPDKKLALALALFFLSITLYTAKAPLFVKSKHDF